MTVFRYSALTEDRRTTEGIVDAGTAREAREKLRRQGLFVTSIEEVDEDGGGKAFSLGSFFRKRKMEQVTMLTRQLSTLIGVGLPIEEALTAVIEQTDSASLEAVLRRVRDGVRSGKSFADALAEHPAYFSELYVNVVRAGEASGNMDLTLNRLADYLSRQHRLRGKISAAMTYPVIMATVALGVVIFLLQFVIPKVEKMLTDMGRSLPLATRLLVGASAVVRDFWWVGLLIAVAAAVGVRFLLASEKGRFFLDNLLLRLPVFGALYRKQAVSRFAVTFATLLASGIPALQALGVVKKVVNNKVMEKTIENVRERITAGTDISTPIKKSGIFPPIVGYMIAIGEESGRLEEVLERIAESYDEELEVTTQKLTALMEPVMILILATVVGLIALSVILPILDIAGGLK